MIGKESFHSTYLIITVSNVSAQGLAYPTNGISIELEIR